MLLFQIHKRSWRNPGLLTSLSILNQNMLLVECKRKTIHLRKKLRWQVQWKGANLAKRGRCVTHSLSHENDMRLANARSVVVSCQGQSWEGSTVCVYQGQGWEGSETAAQKGTTQGPSRWHKKLQPQHYPDLYLPCPQWSRSLAAWRTWHCSSPAKSLGWSVST